MKKSLAPFATVLPLLLLAAPLAAAWDDGVAAFNAGRFQEAAREFQGVVDRSPEAPEGHYMLGLSLLRQLRPGDAVEPLGRAVKLRPEAGYRLALAQAQLAAGAADDALQTLAAQDPATVEAELRSAYGQLLAKAATLGERPEDAAAVLERALAAGMTGKPLWLAKAHTARRLGRPAETFTALAAAFELDPTDGELGRRAVRTAFAVARSRDGDGRRAAGPRSWYLEGAEIAGRLAVAAPVPENLLLAGEALLGAGDYAAARRRFEQAAAAGGADPLPHYYAGRCDLALGEATAALERFAAALERTPDDELRGQIDAGRGAALRRLERFDEAAAAYRRTGDETRALEMEDLARIYRDNQQWSAEKRRCEDKRRRIEGELEENDFLAGTEAWRRLRRDADRELADCQVYLEEG